jgi:hypothetical protein
VEKEKYAVNCGTILLKEKAKDEYDAKRTPNGGSSVRNGNSIALFDFVCAGYKGQSEYRDKEQPKGCFQQRLILVRSSQGIGR